MGIRTVITLGVGLAIASGCTLPTRTATLEATQRRQQDDLEILRGKVTELEAKVATLGKRVGSVQSAQGAARRTPDGRVTAIGPERTPAEERTPDATSTGGATRTVAPRAAQGAAPELDVEGLRRESARQLPSGYARGLARLRDGAYDEAIQAMRDFVRAKHGSPFVPGAYYWIGQAHLQMGQPYQAILAFTEVQQRSPGSEHAPAAGLASGMAFLELGNGSEARRSFEKVVREYPGTPEAAKASARLQAMETSAR